MNVIFLVDYRGRETKEMFYKAGSQADIEDVELLLENGFAKIGEVVITSPTEPEEKEDAEIRKTDSNNHSTRSRKRNK